MARVYLDRVRKDVSTKPSTKHYRAQIVAAILEILARAFDHETKDILETDCENWASRYAIRYFANEVQ